MSPSGVPASASGLDPLTLRLMRWTLARWYRAHGWRRARLKPGGRQIRISRLAATRRPIAVWLSAFRGRATG